MLVLARKVGQSIVIGDNIELMVIEVRGDQVRLGVNAPKNIPVHRKELLEQIRQENLMAADDAEEISKAIDDKTSSGENSEKAHRFLGIKKPPKCFAPKLVAKRP